MAPQMLDDDEAAGRLAEVRVLRRQTLRRLQTYWFALLVFGTLLAASAPFFGLFDGAGTALYWLVAAPVGTVLVVRRSRDQGVVQGVSRSRRGYFLLGAGLVVACFGLGFGGGVAGSVAISEVGPPVAIAIGYLVLAWIERSARLATLAAALGACCLVVLGRDVSSPGAVLAVVYGASFIAVGLVARPRVDAR
ncbi:MAG: hypothetical protein ACLPVY_03525 [Acidimicrobiia bacterium]